MSGWPAVQECAGLSTCIHSVPVTREKPCAACAEILRVHNRWAIESANLDRLSPIALADADRREKEGEK